VLTTRVHVGSPNSACVAHFLTQRKNLIGLKTVTGVWVFECSSRSHAPCLIFDVGPLAAPVPRPQPQPQPQNPGIDPNAPIGGGEVSKRMAGNEMVREHVFRFDGNGTVESGYV
jgi:hypothetical protein